MTVDVTATALAFATNVVVEACCTVPTDAPDLTSARVAGDGKRVTARVVKVVEEHDGGMFGTTERVELIVTKLAHLKD